MFDETVVLAVLVVNVDICMMSVSLSESCYEYNSSLLHVVEYYCDCCACSNDLLSRGSTFDRLPLQSFLEKFGEKFVQVVGS